MAEQIEVMDPRWDTYSQREKRGVKEGWATYKVVHAKISGLELLKAQDPEYQRDEESESYRDAMIEAVYGNTMEPVKIACQLNGGRTVTRGGKQFVKIEAEHSNLLDGKQRKLLTMKLLGISGNYVAALEEWKQKKAQGLDAGPKPEQPTVEGIPIHGDIWFDVTIYFGTPPGWEVRQFDNINGRKRNVKSATLVRNRIFDPANTVLIALYQLFNKSNNFPHRGWFNWGEILKDPDDDRKRKGIPILVKLRADLQLYRNFGVGNPTGRDGIVTAMQDLAVQIDPDPEQVKMGSLEGVRILIENEWTLAQLMEGAFKLKDAFEAKHKNPKLPRPQTSTGMYRAVTLFLGSYPRFWNGYTLVIPPYVQSRLAAMKLSQTEVLEAVGGNTKKVIKLAELMVEQVNGSNTKNLLDAKLLTRKPKKGFGSLKATEAPAEVA